MVEEFDYKYNEGVSKNPFVSESNDPPKGQLAYEKEPVICKKCVFCIKEGDYYMCIAKMKLIIDFVTGKKLLRNKRECKEVNTDGKCPDYKEKK